jgi:hypothetical protein
LSEAIGLTILDIEDQIKSELNEEWCYFDTRIFVNAIVNIVDCQGNDLGFDIVVKDSDGNLADKEYRTANGVRVPFGSYVIEVEAKDGYELIESSVVNTLTVDSASGEYVCNFEYHTPGEPVTTTVPPTCTEKGYDVTTVTCTTGNEVLSEVTSNEVDALGHTPVSANNAVAPTLNSKGKEADTICSVCGDILEVGADIDEIKGFTVTVDAVDLGAVKINGEDATDGFSGKFEQGAQITLTAEAVEGATFLGWTVNGKTTISTSNTITAPVLANIRYTPEFDIETEDEFTVTFVDAFANIVSIQKVSNASEIEIPTAPSRPGYSAATSNGWSLSDDAIKALTEGATITAQYSKDITTLYKVTATGCEITVNGNTTTDSVEVSYGVKVTVTKEGATGWKINDATVGYGDSYTFYVVADEEVVPTTDSINQKPTVANIGIGEIDATGLIKTLLKPTRTMADGYN